MSSLEKTLDLIIELSREVQKLVEVVAKIEARLKWLEYKNKELMPR